MGDNETVQPVVSDEPQGTAELAGMERGATTQEAAAVETQSQKNAPLLPDAETDDLRRQWDTIQTGFVDEPRRAVEQADQLVAGAMKRLAEVFATERSQLEGQWDRGDDVSTEDLRIALQRYRAFFGRLLSI